MQQSIENVGKALGSLYATWLTVGIALVGQIAWFSLQYGTLSERVGTLSQRVQTIEMIGSPAVSVLRAQIEVDTHRLDAIEQVVPGKVETLAVADATHEAQIVELRNLVARLRSEIDHANQPSRP